MPRTSDPGRSVSSRLLEILFAFRPERPALTLTDLVEMTGIPHPTVHRLLKELLDVGALERREDHTFTVGVRLWQLGTLAPLTESLRTLAQPFMEDLYTALRQHVQLAVLDGREAVIIERLSTPRAVGLVSQIGGRLPLHCSGVGKVLLSHGGSTLIEDVISHPLRRYTALTVIDPVELRREIAGCRRSGIAIVRGELTKNADSVAARVVDDRGNVVAALSVVVKAGSVSHQSILPTVLASALGMSRRLGWRPDISVGGKGQVRTVRSGRRPAK